MLFSKPQLYGIVVLQLAIPEQSGKQGSASETKRISNEHFEQEPPLNAYDSSHLMHFFGSSGLH